MNGAALADNGAPRADGQRADGEKRSRRGGRRRRGRGGSHRNDVAGADNLGESAGGTTDSGASQMHGSEGFSLQPSAGPSDGQGAHGGFNGESSAPQATPRNDAPAVPAGLAPPRTEGRPAVVWSSATLPSAPDLRADREE
jgi:hypothetical protein